jgi:hypothetical protein
MVDNWDELDLYCITGRILVVRVVIVFLYDNMKEKPLPECYYRSIFIVAP